MEPNQNSLIKTSAKDFFLNLGVIVALYTTVISLINLLFTVINNAYPQINSGYYYMGSQSISMPVATLIIFFPIFILLTWLLEKVYRLEPEKKHLAVRRWLSYITLFVAGIVLAGDLVTILYYFIDGQELTAGFLLKVLSVFVVTLSVFLYYISDIRNKLTKKSQKTWLIISAVIILVSIIWGFSVLGSPYTQRLIKYDNQKITDLANIQWQVISYWQVNGMLPVSLSDITSAQAYTVVPTDPQSKTTYEYAKTDTMTFKLCAEFNKESTNNNQNQYPVPMSVSYPAKGIVIQNDNWNHPSGHYCFSRIIDPTLYPTQVRG
ncbi:MAG: hypothetical protein A3E02_00375 [Candidatus Zambryskibacteria bacterium RIFCSPHIGHO2_12_FULL_38_34]|uniref:DUF5671 domain-containing protein n=1 Tax=Candidatus Zambryskibacteria bacterium RIFCSPLOWO2_12_FULL_39_16 TaxID=1802775 RepID=A0A1G2UU37_9BACT|nr:MAG: hypothetical protein A3D37_00915 [Candidatus Zambryskibacteria bacterium RIFCSPHIGHO2_02_FULL_38_22]OHA97728.1 MAG: hypothetical protein A3E02_00375 [Candidatus Zambryskibacteria bacterium RIFCSPHIGHO2_12_FULL_38_34]OHB09131.1 MAG: hypothetical protein A3I19_02950 [Candidatus Zambryskibacteria bacterium RIFCSPLOWO2_02_FULL_38_13]OHB12762.1 MAG: hypothetical protein A3G46_02890 [Candidatus Zambryskibacteria bacterium RIFCSPLOWO2_12_FULL_39_16]